MRGVSPLPIVSSARSSTTRLPIIVGVTGHRDPRPEDTEALRAAIGAIFARFNADYPATPLLALTPLAAGSDRLFAREAIARNIPFRVPLPLPLDAYRKDFSAEQLAEFENLLLAADAEPYEVGFVDGNDAENVADPVRRAKQYALVGAHVARAAHVVVALWDGKPTDKVGGTAAVVDFRLRGVPPEYLTYKPTLLDAPERGPVYHIPTPRVDHGPPAFPPFALRVITREEVLAGPQADPFRIKYDRIEEFNEDAQRFAPSPPDSGSAVENLAGVASRLATVYQGRTTTATLTIFITAFFAALLLAIYGHIAQVVHELLIPYVVLVWAAIFAHGRAVRGRYQDRFLDYRALDIGLTLQRVWDLAGVDASVADYYIRRQRSELDWIRVAIRTARNLDRRDLVVDPAEGIVAVREFITDQLRYFADAGRRNALQSSLFGRFAEVPWWFAVGIATLFAIGICIGWRESFSPSQLAVPSGFAHTFHNPAIFLIAILSVLAALLQDYPRRRAFREHARRYAMMHGIYDRARLALEAEENAPLARRYLFAQGVIQEIGWEALLENGDWVLLHRQLELELVHV